MDDLSNIVIELDSIEPKKLSQELLTLVFRIASSKTLDSAFEAACEGAVSLLGSPAAFVNFVTGEDIHVVSGWSIAGKFLIPRPWTIPISYSFSYQAIENKEVTTSYGFQYPETMPISDGGLLESLEPILSKTSNVSFPIGLSEDALRGVFLVALNHSESINDNELAIGKSIARALTIACDNNEFFIKTLDRKQALLHEQMSQQLHDSVAQELFVLNRKFNSFLEKYESVIDEKDGDELRSQISSINSNLHVLLNERLLSDNANLTSIELYHAEVTKHRELGGCEIVLMINEDVDQMSIDARIVCLSVIRESLNNIRKHAKANFGFISFSREQEHFVLVIQNDGAEADVNGKEQSDSKVCESLFFGLSNLLLLVSNLDGQLSVNNEDGIFTIKVTLPA